ncbi:MAG: formylglycine-generating enzyme family protein [Desulfobacterales bacterium]|nr:formylglycine-generating enzyme family protein [Desulfobacterales bacterium]
MGNKSNDEIKSTNSHILENPHVWIDPITQMEFVWVKSGKFIMGCGEWDGAGDDDEYPIHEVYLDGFWMGKYQVNQDQWKIVMKNNPAIFNKGGNYPVENVSWYAANEFIKRLSSMNMEAYKFSLPTEAQWEYAARSKGKIGKYSGGDFMDRVAWYAYNSGNCTHPVGQKNANGLGLYDMSGNVWEWCLDVYNEKAYSKHEHDNPVYLDEGKLRVNRGGSWGSGPGSVRCSARGYLPPEDGYSYAGFRVVRTIK